MAVVPQPTWVEETEVYVAPNMNPRRFAELIEQHNLVNRDELNELGANVASFQAQFDQMRAEFQRQFDQWKEEQGAHPAAATAAGVSQPPRRGV